MISPFGGTVTPIRTAINTALKPVEVGTQPWEIAITPDGKTAYVTSALGVVPIRTATNTALKAVKVSGQLQPWGIAITPDGKTAYAVGSVLTPIRTATNTALKAIQLAGLGVIVVVIR